MKIVVLVKQVPDTWGSRKLDLSSGRLDRAASELIIDEISERAIETALTYQGGHDAEVVVLAMGPASAADALKKGLAMGADSAVHIIDEDLAGADLARTAAVLASAITHIGFDLVVCGNESTDGRGGVIPSMLAEHLKTPSLAYLNSVEIAAGSVSGDRETEYGIVSVSSSLPAVISITDRSPEPRFPTFKGIMKAKKKPITQLSLTHLATGLTSHTGRSIIVTTNARPARSAGQKVVDDGSAAEQLADFLASERLI